MGLASDRIFSYHYYVFTNQYLKSQSAFNVSLGECLLLVLTLSS